MSYKDFSQLNAALQRSSLSPLVIPFQRAITDANNLVDSVSKLPTDWARSYAGVMVLKYDTNGNPTDVTDQVTGSGKDAPNSLVSNAKRNFIEAKQALDKDIEVLNSQEWESRHSINLANTLTADTNPPASGTVVINWITIPTTNSETIYLVLGYDSGELVIWTQSSAPSSPRVPDGSEIPLAYSSSYLDSQKTSMGSLSVLLRRDGVTYLIQISLTCDENNGYYYLSYNEMNVTTRSIASRAKRWIGSKYVTTIVSSMSASTYGSSGESVTGNSFASNIKLGDVIFVDEDTVSDLEAAVNGL